MAQVEVYEVLCLMCDKRAKVAADDAVPGWALALVELGVVSTFLDSRRGVSAYLLLDVHGDVLWWGCQFESSTPPARTGSRLTFSMLYLVMASCAIDVVLVMGRRYTENDVCRTNVNRLLLHVFGL